MLKTIVLFSFVGFSMIALTPLGLVTFIFGFGALKKPMALIVYKVAQYWARFLIFACGCSLTVTGQEYIPKKGGLCIVSNHASIFDIVLAIALIGRPFGFIAKKELALIPFLNMWILLTGGSFIDRKNNRKAIATINRGITRIKEGGAMIVFPEGTRSKGRGLLPFRPGSLKLASRSGAPAVPMAIAGSYDVFEKTGRVIGTPIRVVFAPPIDAAALPVEERKQTLSDQIYRIIEAALEAQ
jgi:1-acyl-sn-glycerol-3-phosphate acyltransferase